MCFRKSQTESKSWLSYEITMYSLHSHTHLITTINTAVGNLTDANLWDTTLKIVQNSVLISTLLAAGAMLYLSTTDSSATAYVTLLWLEHVFVCSNRQIKAVLGIMCKCCQSLTKSKMGSGLMMASAFQEYVHWQILNVVKWLIIGSAVFKDKHHDPNAS